MLLSTGAHVLNLANDLGFPRPFLSRTRKTSTTNFNATYDQTTMFSAVSDRIGAPSLPEITRASPDSVDSVITVDCPATLSSSSTPPTSIGDGASVSSASLKLETPLLAASKASDASAGRSRRTRTSVGTYNVKVLSGTAVHVPRKYRKDEDEADMQTRRRTISGDTLIGSLGQSNSSTETVQKHMNRLVRDGIDTLDLQWSNKKLSRSKSFLGLGNTPKKAGQQKDQAQRKLTRSAGDKVESFAKKLSVLGKRGRQNFENGLAKAKRELRNLADTNEFAGIETKPVLFEVWSKGKLVTEEPPKKKKKVEEVATPDVEDTKPADKITPTGYKEKVWLSKGLYAGQDASDLDWWSKNPRKGKDRLPDIATYKPNSILPMPMWHGQRLLDVGRDFKLPFDVCSPLPPGQPKPDEWRKTSSSKSLLQYWEEMFQAYANLNFKIDLWVKLLRCGKSLRCLTVFTPNASAPQNMGVMRTAKTELCSMSVMIQTVHPDVSTAPTALLLISRNAGEVAASTELALK